MNTESFTGIVLAGGKSRRMGMDKGMILLKGKSLARHAIDTLSALCTDILISANDPVYESFGYPIINDEFPGAGPMAGIYSSLQRAQNPKCLVIPVDTPLISADMYRHLLKVEEPCDALVSVDHQSRYQPLCAIYYKSILPIMKDQISKKILGFEPLFKRVKCIPVPFNLQMDFYNDKTFSNINSPEDLADIA